MSQFRMSTQLLSQCGFAWLRAGPVVASTATVMAVPLAHHLRHVSTTRPKKAQAMKEALKEIAFAPVEKAHKPSASASAKTRKSSTKATAAAAAKAAKAATKTAPAKTRVVNTTASSSAPVEAKPPATAKKTAAVDKASSPAPDTPKQTILKAAPPPSKAKVPECVVASASTNGNPIAAGTARSMSPGKVSAPPPVPRAQAPPPPVPAPPAAAPPAPRPAPSKPTPQHVPYSPPSLATTSTTSQGKRKVDTASAEYKARAWAWTSSMVAMPILLVTSYYLFDRLILGHEPDLEAYRQKLRDAVGGPETAASDNTVQTNEAA